MVEPKYWKPLAALAVVGLLFGAWHLDRAMQYRKGRADEAAKINLTLAEAANKQAAAAREKERRAAAELAERQVELEKERQDAEKSIGAMRLELDRLRQHAARQSGICGTGRNSRQPSRRFEGVAGIRQRGVKVR